LGEVRRGGTEVLGLAASSCASSLLPSIRCASCDIHGPITTDPGRCLPLYDLQGNLLSYVCTCEASTPYCGVFRPFPG